MSSFMLSVGQTFGCFQYCMLEKKRMYFQAEHFTIKGTGAKLYADLIFSKISKKSSIQQEGRFSLWPQCHKVTSTSLTVFNEYFYSHHWCIVRAQRLSGSHESQGLLPIPAILNLVAQPTKQSLNCNIQNHSKGPYQCYYMSFAFVSIGHMGYIIAFPKIALSMRYHVCLLSFSYSVNVTEST